MALALFLGAMLLAHNLYPDYTFSNFRHALSVYHSVYVNQASGIAYGSSLLGALVVLNALYHLGATVTTLEIVTVVLAVLYVATLGYLALRNKLKTIEYIFILVSIYALFSGIFGDYHLIVFFAIAMLIARLSDEHVNEFKPEYTALAAATILLLSPKNYLFSGDISLQVVLNPMILIYATARIFGRAIQRDRLR